MKIINEDTGKSVVLGGETVIKVFESGGFCVKETTLDGVVIMCCDDQRIFVATPDQKFKTNYEQDAFCLICGCCTEYNETWRGWNVSQIVVSNKETLKELTIFNSWDQFLCPGCFEREYISQQFYEIFNR